MRRPCAGHEYLFTSGSVTEGHPDKMADRISDAVLDAALAADPGARVACETLLTTGLVVLAGEIITPAELDISEIVRRTIRDIGYTAESGFDPARCAVLSTLGTHPPGVAREPGAEADGGRAGSEDMLDRIGPAHPAAGDQGMVFGYATNETPELMPMAIALAHRLSYRLAQVRKSGLLPYLGPDGRAQVTVRYRDSVPVAVEKVIIVTQHDPGAEDRLEADLWHSVVLGALPAGRYDPAGLRRNFFVNPAGRFVTGGPAGDPGLTGRQMVVDTYGGFARHGGAAFSGQDPSKVGRSAAYAVRHAAKNIVAAGLAGRAEVQVAYAAGRGRPLSLLVETFGTERVSRTLLQELVSQHFDLRPAALREELKLHRPIYAKTAAYGHFGRDDADFTWEATDKADVLRAAAGLPEPAAAG
jgi:S-adenosylmethionine synthetase